MQSGRAVLSFSATHTERIDDDALLSLISLFNESRGSPGQRCFHFQANLITRESDSDKTVQESSAPASCSDIISSSVLHSFCESIYGTFCSFFLLSSLFSSSDWCDLVLGRCSKIIFHVVPMTNIVFMSNLCIIWHIMRQVNMYINIIFLAQCVSCVFVLQAICVHVSDSQCVCWCVRPSVPYRVWSSLPKLCLSIWDLGSGRQICTRSPSQMCSTVPSPHCLWPIGHLTVKTVL